MTSAQFELHDLVLVPLTPIHVGGGDEAVLGPEDCRLKDRFLERVDLRDFILSAPDSEALLNGMEKDLQRTMANIRGRIPDEAVKERIAVSDDAARALKPAFQPSTGRDGRRRQGTVHAFLRSGGHPTLPGSSLKGCLRTAWLARCASVLKLSARDIGPGKSGQRHVNLTELAFATDIRETATDPFRDVTVTDARLPEAATRVDLVSSWKHNHYSKKYMATSGKILLMRERMRSVADGGEPPLVPVRIGLRSGDAGMRRRKAARADVAPGKSPGSMRELLSALEDHHAPLWRREMEKFFPESGRRLVQALGLFDGMSRGGERPAAALVRMGWATHAEAKSVAGFREIHRPQFRGTRDEYAAEGSSRHVVNLPGGPYPFGWALLVMADDWRTTKDTIAWLPEVSSARRNGGARSVSDAGPRKGPELTYRKGDVVLLGDGSMATVLEDVKEGQSEVQVDIDGSPEPVKVSEIERLA